MPEGGGRRRGELVEPVMQLIQVERFDFQRDRRPLGSSVKVCLDPCNSKKLRLGLVFKGFANISQDTILTWRHGDTLFVTSIGEPITESKALNQGGPRAMKFSGK
jgi:hypothetical protein